MDFEKLLSLIKLHGPSYTPLKKATFYAVLLHRVRKSIVNIGGDDFDLRLPLNYCLPSGHGKRVLKKFIKGNTPTDPNRSQNYCEPTSLHPEQLVGKTVREQNKKGTTYEKIHGFLDATFVVIDEAIPLLTENRHEEARRYVRTALDPIGDNTIMKRLVNIPVKYRIEYEPDCSMALFIQDVGGGGRDQLPYELLSQGLLRRFLILYLNISEQERLGGFASSKVPVDDTEATKEWELAIQTV